VKYVSSSNSGNDTNDNMMIQSVIDSLSASAVTELTTTDSTAVADTIDVPDAAQSDKKLMQKVSVVLVLY
jgi:hypothetical protein